MQNEQESSLLALTSEESVEQMIALAERLRSVRGGELTDDDITAVAEATGAPLEFVRVAFKVKTERENRNVVARVRSSFMTMDPSHRRYVAATIFASISSFFAALELSSDAYFSPLTRSSPTAIIGIVKILAVIAMVYNLSLSKSRAVATIAGVISGASYFILGLLFNWILRVPNDAAPEILLLYGGLGALIGGGLWSVMARWRARLGLRDPAKERQELLQQLVQIQDKLRSGERHIAFLSVDIVGSTQMKQKASPLNVEYTFTEYHQYVADVSRRYGGRVHSTAGDGVTCAFDAPTQAYGAARTMQAGLAELNKFRNKIGVPLCIRCGVHADKVIVPDEGDISSVNFSHVIDIAAHLQKLCPPGGVAISESSLIASQADPKGFGTASVEASGVKGIVWTPKVAISTGPPAIEPSGA